MDPSFYKELTVQRGLTYRYYWSPPAPDRAKPTLLFLDGFPSMVPDWHRQVAHFQPLGYGILVPDLLGTGGTDKPLDVQAFRMNAMARDVMDILAAEDVSAVVALAHDWGSPLLSRLAVLHPETFLGYVWVSIAFWPPVTAPFDLEAFLAYQKQTEGHEAFAYWHFFLRDDAPAVIEKNVDSYLQLLYPNDAEVWRTYMATRGKTAELVDGNVQLGRPSYLSDEEYARVREALLVGGVGSALTWYKAHVTDVNLEDSRNIPEETWKLKAPSLVFLPLKNCVCTPGAARAGMEQYGSDDVEYCELDCGHWAFLERTEEVNDALRGWLERRGW